MNLNEKRYDIIYENNMVLKGILKKIELSDNKNKKTVRFLIDEKNKKIKKYIKK